MRPKIIYYFFFQIALTFISFLGIAGNGLPDIRNFSKADYGAGTQNWSFGQSQNGLIYFANNDGLLEFDGKHWQLYKQESSFIHRSSLIKDDHIFIGGLNEFGYYKVDPTGNLCYNSLVPKLPEGYTDFGEVWRIHDTSFGIVFQTFQHLLFYQEDSIILVEPKSRFHFSYYVNDLLWVCDVVEGLMQYQDGQLRKIPNGDFFSGLQIWSVLPYGDDQIIIGTEHQGLYLFDGATIKPWFVPASDFLKKYQLYCSKQINGNTYAFGSIQNGVVIMNKNGEIVQHLNKIKGLQNNTVLSIGADLEGGLWLGLDNGISRVSLDSPISYIEDYFNIGAGYTSVKIDSTLYLGTNQGVYKIGGAWAFLPISKEVNKLLVGHYNGISILKKIYGKWHYQGELKGFNISARFLEKDEFGNIWVGHGYKGVYKLELNDQQDSVVNLVLYNRKNGLASDYENNVYKIGKDILITTRNGIYEYDDELDQPVRSEKYNQLFNSPNEVCFLKSDDNYNIWFYQDSQPGVLRYQEDGSYTEITTPFKILKNRSGVSFEHVSIIDENKVLFGTEGGFAIYDQNHTKNYNQKLSVFLRKIQFKDPSIPQYRMNSFSPENNHKIPETKYNYNSVQFYFAATSFEDENLFFSYKLSGYNEEWSEWSEKSYKEYTYLQEGTYTMQLKARNIYNTESDIVTFQFTILPPFFRSKAAYTVYVVLMAILVLFIRYLFKKNIEKSRLKEIEKQKELFREKEQKLKEEALVAEKEMVKLRNDKLRSDVIHKEKELANSTMHIIQKNNFLNIIKLELRKINNETKEASVKNRTNSIIQKIEKDIDNEKQWEIFELQLDNIHEDFLKRIKQNYPDLSPRELKLCAYLRMNMSSKEIAGLMNITPRGVEIHRYRIRQKLGLNRSENLTQFILGI